MHALVILVKRINRLAIVTDLLNRLVIVGWRALFESLYWDKD